MTKNEYYCFLTLLFQKIAKCTDNPITTVYSFDKRIVERDCGIFNGVRRDKDAVFFSWAQTSVRLCASGSQKYLGKIGRIL